DEVFWIRNILWSWYHHAISCAIWRYHNKKKAQEYSKKALEYQFGNHPNKITKLFYLLTHNKLREAEIWSDGIITEPEKTTAKYLVKEFKDKIIGLDFWINNKLL
ncbi:MAG: hypothetical protein KAS02_01270, partial [Candidatus Pacebacteria bacterium]|nr:hypothetical protein [Candidatus Paceibacterota bacterium]